MMNEKTIHVRGIELHVEIQGEENLPAIVFLHGFTGSTTSWREITKLLKGNYQTIAVDLTGHGKSTIPEDIDRYSMDQQVEDLEELFTELSLDQFILVGYSMGGRVALAYTVQSFETGIVVDSREFFSRIEDESGKRRTTSS